MWQQPTTITTTATSTNRKNPTFSYIYIDYTTSYIVRCTTLLYSTTTTTTTSHGHGQYQRTHNSHAAAVQHFWSTHKKVFNFSLWPKKIVKWFAYHTKPSIQPTIHTGHPTQQCCSRLTQLQSQAVQSIATLSHTHHALASALASLNRVQHIEAFRHPAFVCHMTEGNEFVLAYPLLSDDTCSIPNIQPNPTNTIQFPKNNPTQTHKALVNVMDFACTFASYGFNHPTRASLPASQPANMTLCLLWAKANGRWNSHQFFALNPH